MTPNHEKTFFFKAGVKAFDSIGSIFLSIRSILRPRVVVDRLGDASVQSACRTRPRSSGERGSRRKIKRWESSETRFGKVQGTEELCLRGKQPFKV